MNAEDVNAEDMNVHFDLMRPAPTVDIEATRPLGYTGRCVVAFVVYL